MADWNNHDRTIRRRELEALRAEVAALQNKARGTDPNREDYHMRRAYTRVLAIIDRRIGT